MKIYYYDITSGEYIGTGEARKNPAFGDADQPEYLLPAGASIVQPPDAGLQEVPIFSNGAWRVVIDLRGTEAWTSNGSAVLVSEIGKSLSDLGLTNTPPPAPPAPIPQSVTMRQASIALELAGLLDDVEAIVATLPRVYQIEWQRASAVSRDNPLVEMVRQQQGMTAEQIDALFVAAAAL